MLVSTPAIVLHSFKYGDTSKIVRLLTREHGLQSAIAKGAFRPKSKFGARLQTMSEGVAQLYVRHTRDLQTLGGFDVITQRPALATDVRRYAAAAALAELVLRLSPSEPHPETFDLLSDALNRLEQAPHADLGVIALAALWGMITTLGFSPSLDACARDGRPVPPGAARFSIIDGGLLCKTCAAGTEATKLPAEDRETLEKLVRGADQADPLTPKRETAHRRLFARFVRRHASEDKPLGALAFWESQS
jgi:DNA repair protein RecO (recombination protein O)